MGAKLLKLTDVHIEIPAFEILKSDDGIEVDSKDISISSDGTILHKQSDKPVLLYIREPGSNIPKYHIAGCQTIKSFNETGRLERYVAAYRDKENPSTTFKLNVLQDDGSRKTTLQELYVCKNCLRELNYNGYDANKSMRLKIFSEFDITEFFNLYDTTKHNIIPNREENDYNQDEYPPNWKFISNNYKSGVNYQCEKCGVNLRENKKYLHVHHRNGYKRDCSNDNLTALCIKCHSDEPQHHHIKNSSDYRSYVLLYES
jgi:ribosomal protein S14